MQDPDSFATSVSLLTRIGQNDRDPAAWREFVDRYGRRIYEWCLHRNLTPEDAEDVTQEVLIKLAGHLGTFVYDEQQTFRGWLRRVTENALIDFFRHLRAKRGNQVADSLPFLESALAKEDLEQRLVDAFDLELLDVAKARVKARVDSRRWQAWEMTAIKHVNGAQVADTLRMKLPTVYSSRYQVQRMIADEIRLLESESDSVIVPWSRVDQ